MRRPTIGVFDSGFGGLTVLKALLELIPDADYAYFGDTARLPYGSKSVETVARYAVEAAHYLESHGAQMLVIACNTATALALDQHHGGGARACRRRGRAGSFGRGVGDEESEDRCGRHRGDRQQPCLPEGAWKLAG